MIEMRQFRQFIAVAEELSFRRAADRLHMAQPPLTVTIKQIEEELGTLLIESYAAKSQFELSRNGSADNGNLLRATSPANHPVTN